MRRAGNEAGTQRITLDIAHCGEEMIVVGNRKRLEPTLEKRPGSLSVKMSVPALRVCHREPSHEFGKIAVFLRPKNEMPVIRHHAERQHTHRHPIIRFGENANECLEIDCFFKERGSPDGPVQDMVNVTTSSVT